MFFRKYNHKEEIKTTQNDYIINTINNYKKQITDLENSLHWFKYTQPDRYAFLLDRIIVLS